jgi:NAD(P)H dehydrogenase (quinone)
MKKVLIIHAHPENASFCSSLKNTANDYLKSKGYEVKVSDLYAMDFNPVGNRSDFHSVSNPDFFKYQTEQLYAFENKQFSVELKAEMDKLEWCDILIFNFPLWWFGLPAILKGWVDRVFAMGFVYGGGKGTYDMGVFKDKTAFITMTTGGPENTYTQDGKNGNIESILFPIQHGMFYFVGMTVLPPFISWGPARSSESELHNELERYKVFLEDIDLQIPIYTNKNL